MHEAKAAGDVEGNGADAAFTDLIDGSGRKSCYGSDDRPFD